MAHVGLPGGNHHRARVQPRGVRPREEERLPVDGGVELELDGRLVGRSESSGQVVVDLQDDLRPGIDGHAGPDGKVAAAAPGRPPAERRRKSAGSPEALVPGRGIGVVERLELRDLAGSGEEDEHVMDDGRVPRFGDEPGDVASLRLRPVEQEAAVLVGRLHGHVGRAEL